LIESYHSQPGTGWFRRSLMLLNQCASLLARGYSKSFVESRIVTLRPDADATLVIKGHFAFAAICRREMSVR
jgi:hypothetical protein